ncbi:MAG: type II toxin-antitoxin system VapC family toxin [Brevundimonas sp.]|uniref:type II toxin-antitoxin system VapC family toxin n=1 Tax=Brevundimonas sp. TaxID=1871086 RepID=UPI00391DDC88
MTRPILLDTCALIWLAEGSPLAAGAEAALQDAQSAGAALLVSPITAWEIGMLVAKGRLALTMPPLVWFQCVLDTGIELGELGPDILIGSSSLPGPELRDPADRIIAATARAFNYRLMTRDRPLLAFAESGQVAAIPC